MLFRSVMTREDGQPVQGIIDLIYRCDDRIWIADYKTDRVAAKDVRKRAERYRPQMTYYKTAAQQSLGVSSVTAQLLFLHCGVGIEL